MLRERYDSEVVPKLREELGIENPMGVPRVKKVVVNMGIGIAEKDQFKTITEDLGRITGQKPLVTKARKSVSNFKLREGMSIGSKVTLRGKRMFEFLDRLINAALPRIRDFRGVSPAAFDSQGNYSLGIRELSIFPEIDVSDSTVNQGMDITIVTNCSNAEEARALLRGLGMPFAENN